MANEGWDGSIHFTVGIMRNKQLKCRALSLCAAFWILVACIAGYGLLYFQNDRELRNALNQAGSNRTELEKVLIHYRNDHDKLKAAKYLISALPAHYSYRGERIDSYYSLAKELLTSDLTPETQRDSLLAASQTEYSGLTDNIVSDVEIISADYIISNIESAWKQWKECPWASHLRFDDFLEWLLPYKMTELQSLDFWRDSLRMKFTDGIAHITRDDVEYGTAMKTAETVRNELNGKIRRYGLYSRAGLPLLSAELLPIQTFGDIPDYALTTALTMRAAGIPVVLDETPVGARYEAAVRWFVILSDKGSEETSEWDMATLIGWSFFPYERGPKVWRNTYHISHRVQEYRRNAKFIFPFDLTKEDVTDRYFLTENLKLAVSTDICKSLKDKYVYIASAIRDTSYAQQSGYCTGYYAPEQPEGAPSIQSGWRIIDFGELRHGRACFQKMGREVMYMAYGYDGQRLIPITGPFILHKDRHIEYVSADTVQSPTLDRWRNNPLI